MNTNNIVLQKMFWRPGSKSLRPQRHFLGTSLQKVYLDHYIKIHFKIIYFGFFFTFNLLQIFGCSLATKPLAQSQLTISIAPDQPLVAAHLLASNRSDLSTTVSGFDCFGVNVIGYDIPSTDFNNLPSQDLLNQLYNSTSTCTYPGIMAILPSDTLTTTLNVPSGPKRLIQIFGVTDKNNLICSGATASNLNQGAFFEVGRTITDLYLASQTVNIDNSYDNLTTAQQAARQVRCLNNRFGNTQVSYTNVIQFEPNIIAYWPTGQSGTTSATDLMSSTVPGNLVYGATVYPGNAGPLVNETSYSISLNAIGSAAPNPNIASIDFSRGAAATDSFTLTFETWAKIPLTGACTSPVSGFIFIWNTPTSDTSARSITLGCNSDKQALFQTTTWNTTARVTSTATINDNQWHHLVGTIQAGTISLYVDGTLNNSTSTTLAAADVNFSITDHGALYVGQYSVRGASTTTDTYTSANLSQIAIYTSALSASGVALHYQTALKQ